MDNILLEKNDKVICWRGLTSDDNLEIEKWTTEYFVKSEAICLHSNIPQAALAERVSAVTKKVVALNYSIGAYDLDHKDQLCAVCLLRPRKISDFEQDSYESLKSDVTQKHSSFAVFFCAVIDGVRKYTGNETFLYVNCIGTYPDYGRMGIMLALHKKAEIIAKEQNYRYIAGVYTSVYSQRIAKKLGYKTAKEIAYKDYIDPRTGKKYFEMSSNCAIQHQTAMSMVLEVKNDE